MDKENNSSEYDPIDIRLVSTGLKGVDGSPLTAETITSDKLSVVNDFEGSKLSSKVNFDVTGFTPDTASNKVYYGVIADEPKINEDAVIKVKMTPPNNDGAYKTNDYYYGVDGVPFCGEITASSGKEVLELKNAKPGYKFIAYEVEEAGDNFLIKKFGTCELTQDLIKYPCEVKIGITKGSGLLKTTPISIIKYNGDYSATIKPDSGWEVSKIEINTSDGKVTTMTKDQLAKSGEDYIINISKVTRDTDINVIFSK